MAKGGKQIPIEKKPKTLEQQTSEERLKLSETKENANGDHIMEPWTNELDKWMDDETHSMRQNMDRMRNNMLSLFPMDQPFELDRWHHFGGPMLAHFPDFGSNMFDNIERDMEVARQKMMTDTGMDKLMPKPEHVGEMMNTWKDAYEVGDDGKLHFKVRFDMKDFKPEHVNVGTVKNKLVVHAKESETSEDGNTKTAREFCRTIALPKSVEAEQIKANMTDDGVLVLEAPANDPHYHAISFDNTKKLAIKPHKEPNLPLNNTSGMNIVGEGDEKKLHFEMAVEPEFHADDIRVRTDNNKIVINGNKIIDGKTHEFNNSMETPETIDPAHVRAQLNNHVLIVEAPFVNVH